MSIRKFTELTFEDQRTFLRAWLLLGVYRAAVSTLSFRRLAGGLGHSPGSREPGTLERHQRQRAEAIGRLVAAAARRTPWNSTCLVQVLVTQKLLAGSGIPGQFYLGAQRRDDARQATPALSAHAWLQCGDVIVNGAAGHEDFTVLSTFHWEGG